MRIASTRRSVWPGKTEISPRHLQRDVVQRADRAEVFVTPPRITDRPAHFGFPFTPSQPPPPYPAFSADRAK
jgi:hypothetical protein